MAQGGTTKFSELLQKVEAQMAERGISPGDVMAIELRQYQGEVEAKVQLTFAAFDLSCVSDLERTAEGYCHQYTARGNGIHFVTCRRLVAGEAA